MKLRPLCLSLILILVVYPVTAATPLVHGWSQRYGDNNTQIASEIAIDASGNIIVGGRFFGTIDLGGGPLASAGSYDIFVAKFDPAGNHLWSKRFGDTGSDILVDLAVDGAGNLLITGYFHNTIDFGGGVHTSVGSGDIFIARLDGIGGYAWSKSFGDTGLDLGFSLAEDGAGNIILGGHYDGIIDFGGGPLVGAGGFDIFVVKFDGFGNHVWSQNFGDAQSQTLSSLTVDSSDNIIATGSFTGAVDFGGGPLGPVPANDIFLVKFDAAGTHAWSHQYGDADFQYATVVAVDGSDNILLGGDYYGAVDFGGGALVSQDLSDSYLAKFDAAGAHIWSRQFAGLGDDILGGMAVEGADNIVVTGSFYETLDVGGGTMRSAGDADAYLARYDAAGTHLWSQRFGYSLAEDLLDVALDGGNNVALPGYFSGTVDFGGGPLVSNGSSDACVVKFWRPHTIADVSDVPGDQGGEVNVAWNRFGADTPGEHAITEYTLWRGIDVAAYMAMVDDGAIVSPAPTAQPAFAAGTPFLRVEQTAQATYYWQLMKTVPAYYLPTYYDQVPTQYDSTSVSTQYQYFQIIAHTADPYVFYVSDPDSGYSVDNLPPAMVINLAGEQLSGSGGLAMTWDPNIEADLDHYVVYRSTTPDFVPGPGNVIGTTTDPALDDGTWTWDSGYYYKVAAVDEHGNEGEPALLGPGFVTGIGPTAVPDRNYLGRNVPNPFNPTTTIHFGLKESARATLRVYDASGQLVRTLVDDLQPAGPNEITWHGNDDQGRAVASGVYFCRLEVGGESFSRKLVMLK